MANVICVTGAVGCGKTTYARKLAKRLGYTYVDVRALLTAHGLDTDVDVARECIIVDVKKLNKVLIRLIKKGGNLVLDSHLSHYLPSRYVTRVIVCTTSLQEQKKRLEKRGYSAAKVRENLDAAIFDVCLVEAVEAGHTVEVVHT